MSEEAAASIDADVASTGAKHHKGTSQASQANGNGYHDMNGAANAEGGADAQKLAAQVADP